MRIYIEVIHKLIEKNLSENKWDALSSALSATSSCRPNAMPVDFNYLINVAYTAPQ